LHPPAQFLRAVLVHNSDLIFIPVGVRHVCSPSPGSGGASSPH
jgi:cupin superfamily acireductone dioxygenase involved in methionine salvage